MSVEAPELANGQLQTAPARVKFGPGKTQDMPLAWAEFMLNELRSAQENGRKPEQFGVLLARAAMEAR